MSAGPNRIAVIDGLRGYFLVLMMSSHLKFQDEALLLRLHHGEFSFVEDAQGFVFLSGLVIGLTYARILMKQGPRALTGKAFTRVGELYRLLLVTLFIVVGAAYLLPDGAQIWGWQLGRLAEAPLDHIAAAVSLLYQPAYLDILPQYMLYLAVAPFIVRATVAGHGLAALAASFALWMMTQMGLHLPAVDALARLVAEADSNGTIRSYFNPLGWQFLFVCGVVLGAAVKCGRLDVASLLDRRRADLAIIAGLLVTVFAGYRVVHGLGDLGGTPTGDQFYRLLRREDLSLVYVVNFAAIAYVTAWLLRNAAEEGLPAPVAFVSRTLHYAFRRPFFVFLGQHSLQVYAFHVLVAYAIVALDWAGGPFDEMTKSLIIIAAVGSLVIPAFWHSMNQQREAARARQVAALGQR
ncbi:MAG: OpgC domain-containing protein [Zavarzinia sp.]|nr:OpgC domain-containing protein [Zavarzinia sp.]